MANMKTIAQNKKARHDYFVEETYEGYEEYKRDISYRKNGSLIAYERGDAITYGLFNAQERGTLFIGPGEKVYAGMIVGDHQ